MKKAYSAVVKSITLVLAIISSMVVFVACGKINQDDNDPEHPQEPPVVESMQDTIDMSVSASADKLTIDITCKVDVESVNVSVIGVKAYEYFAADSRKGVSVESVGGDESYSVGTYVLGTDAEIETDRVVYDYDRIYDKFYIVYGETLVKGPVYATYIDPKVKADPKLDLVSKKGVLYENEKIFDDLNCSYATLNISLDKLIYPNELFEDGTAVPLAPPTDAYKFTSNGKNFYFRKAQVDYLDRSVKHIYEKGAHVTAILNAEYTFTDETYPSKLTYAPYRASALAGINTSNRYGFEYFIAIMEFLADRYTRNDFENGYIGNYVICNEIDYPFSYFRISEKQADFDVYMEEYSRLLRLAELAVKKYNGNITVCAPFTYNWADSTVNSTDPTALQGYYPKQMIEWLNETSKAQGDYNWAIAPHSYTYGLAQPPVFLNDTLNGRVIDTPNGRVIGMTNNYSDTALITVSNIELLDMFLNQSHMKFDGKTREVYMTETGVSTYLDTEEYKNQQAGHIAAIWYKLSQLDCITAFSYYRIYDHSEEISSGARFGLIDVSGNQKPAYTLYKYIDTQYSEFVAAPYLQYVTYVDSEKNLHSVDSEGEYKISSYMDVLDIFETGYDFSDFDWVKATPRKAESVLEWDDKIDLSTVRFESKNYLYDGNEKRIEVVGVPSGVDVSYDTEPVLTEVGSKEVTAIFSQDGEVVGRRRATISVGPLATNKTVYNYGEKIFVTVAKQGLDITNGAWVGIFREDAVPGGVESKDISLYYAYVNTDEDDYIRTYAIQDTINNARVDIIPAGNYKLYYFDTENYTYLYSIDLTVLDGGMQSGTIDLSGVTFIDSEENENGEPINLEITGDLPNGVSVCYIDNSLTAVGSINAVAVFEKDGIEIERRYAVLTLTSSNFKRLMLEKTTFIEGENVFVTATAPSMSIARQWWVGLYLPDDEFETDVSIYWYYVKDDNHISGQAYNIAEQSFNAAREEYRTLPVGRYMMVLFNTSGYTVEMSIEFEIIANTETGASIALEKTEFGIDENIAVTATIPDNAVLEYTVGLFYEYDVVDPANALYSYIVEGLNGSGAACNLRAQANANPSRGFLTNLCAGKYKVVLFAGRKIVDSVEVTIGTPGQSGATMLFTDKTEYKVGEDIYVAAYAPMDSEDRYWWVGFYRESDDPASTTSIYWYYVKDASHINGQICNIFSQPPGGSDSNITAGSYKMVLFNTSGYTVETQIVITVVD